MISAYLDSDSDHSHGSQQSDSDNDLPACTVRSPFKIPKLETQSSELSSPGPSSLSNPPKPNITLHKSPNVRQLFSAQTCSFGKFSPNMSPPKLIEHERTLHHQNKLIRKVEKLSKNIEERAEKKSKLEHYKSVGGILGMSRRLEEQATCSTSSEADGEEESTTALEPATVATKDGKQHNLSDRFPFPPSPPGLAVLVHPPQLIQELYPPGFHEVEGDGPFDKLERNQMMQQNPLVLKEMIKEEWLIACYRSRPCPTIYWEWLFQIMCLSCDQGLANQAFKNLKALIKSAVSRDDEFSIHVPSTQNIVGVLVELGADRDRLEGKEKVTAPPMKGESDDVFYSLTFFGSNFSHLFEYLSEAISARPSALTDDDLLHLIRVMATISLDPTMTEHPSTHFHLSQVLSSLVTAIPEDSWLSIAPILSSQLTLVSSHHHDLLHLSNIISVTSPRLKLLQVMFCREAIWKLVFPEKSRRELEMNCEWTFAWMVVKHYYDQPAANFIYYKMYSVMSMFNRVLCLSEMNWPSMEKKRSFRTMLRVLASVKIKDRPEQTDRAPVKDLIMNMSLDVPVSRDIKQTDLFTAFS